MKRKGNLCYKGIGRLSPQTNYSEDGVLPEDGMPVGTGRMGTLVWLTPNALHMQINRVDVFGMDSSSHSVNGTDSDFSEGCAFFDIELGRMDQPVFDENTTQELSVENGRMTIHGNGVEICCYGNMTEEHGEEDFLIVEIQDRRPQKERLRADLRTLRFLSQYPVGCNNRNYRNPVMYKEGVVSYQKQNYQLSESLLHKEAHRIGLEQIFTEKAFYCRSLVEVEAPGSRVNTWYRNPTEVVLETEAEDGNYVFAIASYATLQKDMEFRKIPLAERCADMAALRRQNEAWWKSFWERTPLYDFTSENGRGQQITEDIDYFYYIMAITSRGSYMPRYGGLLFSTGGDFKMWGAQYWWHNSSCYYAALISSGCTELAEAFVKHMKNWQQACEKAAVQQWGSRGLWIPETTWFNGPEEIPEELQTEFQELYTCKRDWSERTEAFRKFAEGRNSFDSRYSYLSHRADGREERGFGPFGYVSHIFSTTAKIAYWMWRLAEMKNDENWLRENAYPFLKGCAELYVNLPLIREEEDGKLHIIHTNNHEVMWDCRDAVSELAAMHGILPIAIKAAERLEIDQEEAAEWKEFLRKLAPMPVSTEPEALTTGEEQEECWASARSQARKGNASHEHVSDPLILYDLCTPETENEEIRRLGQNTLAMTMRHFGYGREVKVNTLDMCVDAVARCCQPEAMEEFVGAMHDLKDYERDFTDLEACAQTKILANRMTLREGPQAPDVQRLGHITSSMANAVCQGYPKAPGEDPVLYLFSSLPSGWNAHIRVNTEHGYLAEAVAEDGICSWIRLIGSTDKMVLRNPWGERQVKIAYEQTEEIQQGKYLTISGSCRICSV